MKELKNMKIKNLIETYLKKETVTTGDVALPDDKAAYDTPAGKKDLKKNKKKKKKKALILGKDGEPKKGGSS